MYELATAPLAKATLETVYMVFMAGFLSIFCGLILGTFLFVTAKQQSLENTLVQRVLGTIINVTRSIPFIILMISIIPLTRLLVGTTIGTNATIVPLTIAAIPFFARVCENALAEVPYGLIEAGTAMGATTWQIVTKILIPESLPSLIRGATLTIIGLVGYSAMAGVIGGGGLGELAVNYGYQRFNATIMFETVLILVVIVQLIQMLGDKLSSRKKMTSIVATAFVLWGLCLTYQFLPSFTAEKEVIRVGVMSGWPEQVMQVAQKVAKNNYDLQLQIVTFSDYVQPNTALNNKSIDVNIFQHAPYLEGQMKVQHYALAAIGKTFVYPMGFYSKRITSLENLPAKALVAIPNDPSNGGRALLLLQKAGIIKLKTGVNSPLANINDITENKRGLQFKLLDAAQLPRVLKDADLVGITNDYIGPAGLTVTEALIKEGSDSPYANLIVVRAADKENPNWSKLIAVMHSPAVLAETQRIFPNGAAIPAW